MSASMCFIFVSVVAIEYIFYLADCRMIRQIELLSPGSLERNFNFCIDKGGRECV